VQDSKTFVPALYLLYVALTFTMAGCSQNSPHWSDIIPDSALYVIVPGQGSSVTDILDEPYIPLLDDSTPSVLQLSTNIENTGSGNAVVHALFLYPDTATDWQPVWILQPSEGLMNQLKQNYQKEFAQNRYDFGGHTVEKLFIADREIYAADVGNYMLFSESSFGIEQSIRTIGSDGRAMDLTRDQTDPGTFIANTPALDTWVMQMAKTSYRPSLLNLFSGSMPVEFSLDNRADTTVVNWNLNGTLPISDDPSTLLRGIRSPAKPLSLDKYISANAASFSILQISPPAAPVSNKDANFEADRFLTANPEIWQTIASSLNRELAFVTFAESGAESSSEFMFLRKLDDSSALQAQLETLTEAQLAEKNGQTYAIQSRELGHLIGSELNTMSSFYLTITNNVAVLAQRKGLAESVAGDANRRRVMFYDDDYRKVRDTLNAELSSLTYVDARKFGTYIQPWLNPQTYFPAIASRLDLLVISSIASPDDSSAELDIASFRKEVSDDPFRERWVFPLSSEEFTGAPLLADITASGRDEIIFSTGIGTLYVLAIDGTEFFRANTGSDRPVGPPVVYDWYGNNRNVILQAAGNKIYAWNTNGAVLPNFPITLDEQITTPVIIRDVTRNGIAEIIVATADRNLHILNSRGQAISGWPNSVNSVINDQPLITTIDGELQIVAVSENTLHGWGINGGITEGFPVFLDSPLSGTPGSNRSHLLGAGRDGNLYSVGSAKLFSDSLATAATDGPEGVTLQQLRVSPDALNAQPYTRKLLIREGDEFLREELIVVQSSNGSVFLYNTNGDLRFTTSMGQPASGSAGPILVDIDLDQRMDIVSLGDFGRLYAWNILTEERLYGLPTTGMEHPLITDLYGDGNNEIIAFTREGLRCWTILETKTESELEQ